MELADLDYGIPAGVDILLEGKVFSKAVLHGRRFSPTRAPSAFKTCFSWVSNEEVKGKGQQSLNHFCCVTLDDNSLRRFWEIEDHNLQKPVLSPEEKIVVEQFEEYHIKDKERKFIVLLL